MQQQQQQGVEGSTEAKGSKFGIKWKDRLLQWSDIDSIFYRIGLNISAKPWLWLLVSFSVTCIFAPGMLFWEEETDDVQLFMPIDSPIRHDALWVKQHFRDDLGYESILITAPNVLEVDVIRAIRDIEASVKKIVANNSTWFDVCADYLTWFKGDKKSSNDTEDFTNDLLKHINDTMSNDKCLYQSLLKLWQSGNTSQNIDLLSKTDILYEVTLALRNKKEGNILLDIGPLLSGVEYDIEGRVSSANATIMNWILDKSNPESAEWELKFIDRILNENHKLPKNVEIFAVTTRSFKDLLHEILKNNMTILFSGLSLILVYAATMIGKWNLVEQRIYLSMMGVSVVGLAILSSYGICFYFGFRFGPIHPILPFLLLGIGVDDMFVIMQTLKHLTQKDQSLNIPLRIAKTLQHSGVSITVTTITNMVAFGVGTTASMPFLQSFCVFASLGILFLYIFEIMFFVSCLVYDERRMERKKETTSNLKPNSTEKSLQQRIFDNHVGPYLLKKPIKIIVLLVTIFFLTINTWAIFQLDQYFDPLSYLNQRSYPIKFHDKLQEYFPKYGKRAEIYMKGIDYYKDIESLIQLVDKLKTNPYINNRTLDPWFVGYDRWLTINNKPHRNQGSEEYYENLSTYLFFTKEGQSYIKDMKFNKFPIGDYNITTSKISIHHIPMKSSTDQIRAIQSVRDAITSTNLSQGHDRIAIFSQDYVSWTANKIIGEELMKNLGLEVLTIGLITIMLLRNIKGSIWVICCILFTVIDLLGSMYFLGLTIEIASSIMIMLCAGLAVDYAAHVGLEFTRAEGSKNERTLSTLSIIGPAVLNGGISTFLAFVLLSFSDAYIFTTFFKLCTVVVGFGLFHGLLFLPVILSLLGPDKRDDIRHTEIVVPQNKYYTVQLQRHTSGDQDSSTK